MSEGGGFLDELRRRGVVRTGLLYAAGAFALLEFADIAFPRLGLPDGAVNVVLWIGLAGFPVALFLSWAVDVRTQGDAAGRRRWLSPVTVGVALALVALGVAMGLWWGDAEAPPAAGREPTLAVLRFVDPEETAPGAYFAAGLSEEVSTALSRFAAIRVIAPRATAHFEETGADALAGASDLGVDYLLRGSVRRGLERVRVAVQLIDASSGRQLWGEHYDAALETAALLETQDRIAGQVASAVADFSGVIASAGRAEARRRGTDRFEAYDCVLLGLAYLEIHSAEVHAPARDCLERAVEIDPDYADAWAHLAYAYREEFYHGFNPEPDSLERALEAARRALELDPRSPMAHFAMAQTHMSRGEFDAGIGAMERAVELNPNDTVALASLATYHIRLGRLDRGLEIARETAALNPLHPGWLHTTFALVHYLKGDYDRSLEAAARVRIPDDVQTLVVQAATQARLGQPEASATLARIQRADPRFGEAPMRELRRYFLSDGVVDELADGLRLAGLELPDP